MVFHKNLEKTALFLLLFFLPILASAQDPASPNYRIENPTFDIGGGSSNSANYSSLESIGDNSGDGVNSANYKSFLGFVYSASPSIPGIPTLTNTGGNLYSSLDFVITTGSNQSDANYAIAISKDDFTTTYYIQADDTLSNSEAWQDYSGWGGATGERVTGLEAGTTYKIKVKAWFGADSETGFSQTAQAVTSTPSLTIVFSGVAGSTSVAGTTTTVATTANSVPFSSLVISTPAVAAHKLTISTNAVSGYSTTLQSDGELRTQSNQIDSVTATNASPASWPTGITAGRFGYHTTDAVLCTGSTNRFSANDTYAKLTTTPEEVACSSAPVTNEETTVVFKVEIGALQPTGSYSNVLTYITTGKY